MSLLNIPRINLTNLTPYEAHTVAELAELKNDVKSLVGNGQPGRVTKLEDKVFKLFIAVAVIAVLILGPAAVAYFFGG
jgi:hypothetical protein